MKKVMTTLLVVLSMACLVFANGTKETGTAKQEKVIIFQSKVEITDQLSKAAQDFTAETGIPIEIWETTGDDYRAQLKMKLAGDEVPTIFSVSKGAEANMFKSYLADISSGSVQQYIDDGVALKMDGKSVGVPYSVEGFGLVTDESMVTDADFASQDAFFAAIKRLAGKGVNPFGLSQESYFLIGHILNTPFAIMDDPDGFIATYEKGGVRLADQKEFQAFAQLMEQIRANSTNPLEINYDRSCGDFATGKTAMIHQGNWCYGMFKDYNPTFTMKMRPLPLLGNQKIAVSVPYYWVVNSQATSGQQANAIKFLDWLYTSEKGMDYIVNKFGFVPAESNIPTTTLDPLSADVAKAAGSGNTLPWTFNAWPMNIIDTDFAPIAQEFFTTPSMSGIDFVNKLDDAYQARLKK
ncbi:MAG: ABC transporter substrate-binding protein [Sphaerochaeta sp.]|jgi:raffinose/stachyose/melibiose transport system substrate-binding protein|nr:ABC transporter substrate-binding protein [Sphaerochaeta sp.]MCI2097101.1 ABC transporter substrate-binding protein [Sphaerochaeta sp.]MCI2103509.1 ABC transporter substrate-binding protein [Sphaerochaeta sp.]